MPFWSRRHDPPGDDLWLIVGLGNPGQRYERTRHNIGAMVVRAMAERHGLQLRGSRQAADTARGTYHGVPFLLAVPHTFMNESGVAVSRLRSYYRVSTERILIVCDDIDIPFGTLRLRPDGSSGGNNGLKSVIASLGTQAFPRLRIGVGRPRGGAVDHVLGRFLPDQEPIVPRLVGVACDAIENTLVHGVRGAMNRFNRNWLPELQDSAQDAGA